MTRAAGAVDLRLAVPAVAGWIGAVVLVGVPQTALWVGIACWVLAALLWRPLPVAVLSLVVVGLLASVIAAHSAARQPAALVEAAHSGRYVEGQFTATEAPVGDRVSGTLDGGVPVVLFGDVGDLHIGSSASVGGTLRAADAGEDVAFLLYASVVGPSADPPWFLGWADELRDSFANAAAELPGDGARLLPGLAIGDTRAVTPELDAAMKLSSLSHLTAVSGANCAIVVGLIVVAGRLAGLSRTARTVAAAVVLLAFVVLVTPEASVLRAAVMALIVLAALASGRPVRGVPVLALAIIVLLTADPWLARDYGFILSVLATGGLLVLANPLARVLERWLPRSLALVIAVPLAAQLCCQPVLLMLQPSIPIWGVVANVLAEPAAPVATVVGLAACLLLPVFPWLGDVFTVAAWVPAAWIAAVANFFSALPPGSIPFSGGALALALLTALALAAVWVRRLRPMLALALVVTVGIAAGGRLGTVLDRPSDWQVAMCDVGQGDATLVRSAGAVALIDTGLEPQLLADCLADLGITRIDLFVLTHYDADHSGGTDAVLGMVDAALVGPRGEPKHDRIVGSLIEHGATVTQGQRGMTGTLGELRWTLYWPSARGVEPGNDAGLVIGFDCVAASSPCVSSLLLADLSAQGQSAMLAAGSLPPVDVVKVGHHGSRDQDPRSYEQLRAAVGLIGVGADNGYGHPTDELLAVLAANGTAVYRTDQNGLLLVAPGLRVWSARDGPPK
jgi:competence protein ComEC